jgi:glycosyltransferase involved in cell wall biosynthesis
MRICMITHNYTRFKGDNVAPFIRYIVHNLRSLGHEVIVLAAYDMEFDRSLLREEQAYVFKYAFPAKYHIPYGSALVGDKKLNVRGIVFAPFYVLSGFLWLLRLHLRFRFDIINAHWVIPNGIIGVLAAKLCRVPLIISLHGSGIYLSKKNALFRALGRFVFKASDGVTACSPVLRDGALELSANPEKAKVIPYGADVETFAPGNADADSLKERLGISKKELVVLALGRMVEKKGFEYLVRAVPAVMEKYKSCKFVFAGEGPVLDDLKEMVRGLKVEDFVIFPGAVTWKETPVYHGLADIFVVPSIFDSEGNVDGLPNVILESMASGKPIVASRIAGIPLAVKDGENGILVQEKSPSELADAIIRLVASTKLRDAMGKRSRLMAETELNWKETARKFDELYDAAISA